MNNKITQQKFISAQPYKGARDMYPQDMRIRNYIFNIWKTLCKRYGFEEYDFPIIEPFEVFAAKTGEEIVNEQMYNFYDRGNRRLAVRPELTPGTVRMIANRYNQLEKPIKWFMIGNNWRAEKPQKGRGREFYQVEANIFGVEDAIADFEIFSLMINILKEFGGDESMFSFFYSDRRIIKALLTDTLKLAENQIDSVRRLMDKRLKISQEEFYSELSKLNVNKDKQEIIEKFLFSNLKNLKEIIPENILNANYGYKAIMKLNDLLIKNDLDKYCSFNPSIIRGFDYSDGTVYEVFDKNPENKRSMFGGERFDKLINIFGDYELAATGFAMGDYTLLEFLKGWNLLPDFENETKVIVTVFSKELFDVSSKVANTLRKNKINTLLYLKDDKLDKQLKFADKTEIPYAVIIGPDEEKEGKVVLKNLKNKTQKVMSVEEAVSEIQ